MPRVSGNTTIRAGTADPKTYQLLKDDGVTPVDNFTNADKVAIRLINTKDATVLEWNSTDDSDKITFLDKPTAKVNVNFSSLTSAAEYRFHFRWTVNGTDWFPVPEDRDDILTIIEAYPPS